MSKTKEKLKVKVCCINKGQKTQHYILKLAETGNEQVLPYAPNNWKTQAGAISYAEKNGYEVVNKVAPKKPSSPASKKARGEKTVYVPSILRDEKVFYLMNDGSGVTNNITRKDIAVYASRSTAMTHAEKLAKEQRKEFRCKVVPGVTAVTVKV